MDKPDVNPPITEQDDLVETLHGVEVADPYRWLEDFTSDRAATWEQLQNDYTAQFIQQTKLKRAIKNDLEEIWDGESISTPYVQNGSTFYYYNEGEWQHSKLMMKSCITDCAAEVLIDPNTFSEDGTFSLGGTSISPDGKLIAYAVSDGGSDWRTWYVMDLSLIHI